jgi:predicted  nucleic acid-binding Zn-ribbon protein
MSSEDFGKKSDRMRKDLNTLRKDINFRDEQDKRGEATYTLDAEINGQFNQLVSTSLPKTEVLKDIEIMVNNFRNNYKDYNLTISEANKRFKVYEQLINEKNTLKRAYDALFQKKNDQRQLLADNSESK